MEIRVFFVFVIQVCLLFSISDAAYGEDELDTNTKDKDSERRTVQSFLDYFDELERELNKTDVKKRSSPHHLFPFKKGHGKNTYRRDTTDAEYYNSPYYVPNYNNYPLTPVDTSYSYVNPYALSYPGSAGNNPYTNYEASPNPYAEDYEDPTYDAPEVEEDVDSQYSVLNPYGVAYEAPNPYANVAPPVYSPYAKVPSTVYNPYVNVPAVYNPYGNVPSVYNPYGNVPSTVYNPYGNVPSTVYNPYANVPSVASSPYANVPSAVYNPYEQPIAPVYNANVPPSYLSPTEQDIPPGTYNPYANVPSSVYNPYSSNVYSQYSSIYQIPSLSPDDPDYLSKYSQVNSPYSTLQTVQYSNVYQNPYLQAYNPGYVPNPYLEQNDDDVDTSYLVPDTLFAPYNYPPPANVPDIPDTPSEYIPPPPYAPFYFEFPDAPPTDNDDGIPKAPPTEVDPSEYPDPPPYASAPYYPNALPLAYPQAPVAYTYSYSPARYQYIGALNSPAYSASSVYRQVRKAEWPQIPQHAGEHYQFYNTQNESPFYHQTFDSPYNPTYGTHYYHSYGTLYNNTYGTHYNHTYGSSYYHTYSTPYSNTYSTPNNSTEVTPNDIPRPPNDFQVTPNTDTSSTQGTPNTDTSSTQGTPYNETYNTPYNKTYDTPYNGTYSTPYNGTYKQNSYPTQYYYHTHSHPEPVIHTYNHPTYVLKGPVYSVGSTVYTPHAGQSVHNVPSGAYPPPRPEELYPANPPIPEYSAHHPNNLNEYPHDSSNPNYEVHHTVYSTDQVPQYVYPTEYVEYGIEGQANPGQHYVSYESVPEYHHLGYPLNESPHENHEDYSPAAVHQELIKYHNYAHGIDNNLPTEYNSIPKEYHSPSEYHSQTEYDVPSEQLVHAEYSDPDEYYVPKQYNVPSEYNLPNEYNVPKQYNIPNEYNRIQPAYQVLNYESQGENTGPNYQNYKQVVYVPVDNAYNEYDTKVYPNQNGYVEANVYGSEGQSETYPQLHYARPQQPEPYENVHGNYNQPKEYNNYGYSNFEAPPEPSSDYAFPIVKDQKYTPYNNKYGPPEIRYPQPYNPPPPPYSGPKMRSSEGRSPSYNSNPNYYYPQNNNANYQNYKSQAYPMQKPIYNSRPYYK